MLSEFPPEAMPELYFEYLLLLAAMDDMGWTYIKTKPEEYRLISEMERIGNVVSIWGFEQND